MEELNKNLKRKYSFSAYDSNWVARFESIQKSIAEIFKDKALQIEHVGSTSIPGMKAKPLIDVLIAVKSINDLTNEVLGMTTLGYEYGENYIAPHTLLFFKTGSDDEKLENIHVCEVDSPKVRQFLTMRDFLRTFPEKAKQYSDLKELNFQKYPDDYPAYRAAKAQFLEQLEQESYNWASIEK